MISAASPWGRFSVLLFSSVWLFLPYLNVVGSGDHASRIAIFLLFVIAFIFAGFISRWLYVCAWLGVLLVNAVYVHIRFHWGLELAESRFEAALSSSLSETSEYVRIYIGRPEALFLLYAGAGIYLLYRILKTPPPTSKMRIVSAGCLILTWLGIFSLRQEVSQFPPASLVSDMFAAKTNLERISQRAGMIRDEIPRPRHCSEDYSKIVVVIGESALRDRMSLYGYTEKTTPFLDSLQPLHFEAIAPSNQTRHAIPLLLTHASVRDFDAFFHSPSLISELKACGYETWWMSNQGGPGLNEAYVAAVAAEADHEFFLRSFDYTHSGYDGELLDTLGKAIVSVRKQAFFIHLRGSHIDYAERYPAGFGLKPGVDIESRYDNSIYYTDSVLSGIFSKFNPEELLFAYVSDHGEVVSNTKYGHGFYPGLQEEYRVPLVLWARKTDRMDSLMSIVDAGKINTESFDRMMEYLTGLENVPGVSRSIKVMDVSPENVVDYDSLARI